MTAYGIAVKHGYRGSEEQWLADLRYPVGAVYMSVDSTDPNILFGGTWQRIEGQLLVTAGTDQTTGESYSAGATYTAALATGEQAAIPRMLCVYAWKRIK